MVDAKELGIEKGGHDIVSMQREHNVGILQHFLHICPQVYAGEVHLDVNVRVVNFQIRGYLGL